MSSTPKPPLREAAAYAVDASNTLHIFNPFKPMPVTKAITGLFEQNPPNNGVLSGIGALGIDIASSNGFDIGGISNNAWLIATVGGAAKIYSINTTTGAASNPVNFSTTVKGFAVGSGF